MSDGLLAIINNVQKPSSKVSFNVTTRTQYRNEETYDGGQSDIDYDNSGEVLLDVSQEDITSAAAAPSHRRSNRKRPSTSTNTPKLSHSTLSFED
uniref:Uncharacterized protein n=1 Tax=Panagrolaimus sp. PS1159 TaxID=55785 RepID=A0AC35GP26_9BILA